MKILHTSDWHIGRMLYGRKRYAEFASFLKWLVSTINEQSIDVLIVAGDIFDTSTPSNKAQQLYYQFLTDVSATCCRHVIVIGGNHDSPSLLEAPKELLRVLHVHVVGSATERPEDEVIMLLSPEQRCELIVCAVPYLRDRDIRSAKAGETIDDKAQNLLTGIADHYRNVAEIAEKIQSNYIESPPIVATGHLFAAGGKKVEGDGVRDLYIGSLVHIDAEIFPQCIDYLALGHLHSCQMIGGNSTRRYSGSPLPMSFGESKKEKCVLTVSLNNSDVDVVPLPIPTFQNLQTIKGELSTILTEIESLKTSGTSIWLEIIYEGEEIITNLQSAFNDAVAGSALEILRIVNNRMIDRILQQTAAQETLETMTEVAVFQRCLEVHQIPENQCTELLDLFQETVQAIHDEDFQAE
jgi:exonuclease SbcD